MGKGQASEQGITTFLPVLVMPQPDTLPAVIPFKIVVSGI